MLDANDLKGINDHYGHSMGDAYLLGLVEMIQDCFPGCQSYRIGGDEFVVLIEGEDSLRSAADCLKYADAWQRRREEEKRQPWETPTAACAFVEYDPAVHHTAEEVLAAADERMYQKKQQMKERRRANEGSAPERRC